ncbi:hypothetical protein BXY82_1175 [Gelidibacter sediminis]|uniref:Uncharacterized protein n=1 Tax=Gelidibacter sediminis TaxID=1608710 RepID=A0A4R7Q7Y2_9FLAO|nr:hypothetical protein [Gelidibacter sediminis]TDU43757.1 hypothetical protein BXY82_1175 [Gelidibacter sediminis]
MKNLVLLIAFVTFPVLTFGQDAKNAPENQAHEAASKVFPTITTLENQVAIGTFTKNDVNYLSYRKSIELISIKAYRKSLQIKVKEVKNC